jgi:hypothetical protein
LQPWVDLQITIAPEALNVDAIYRLGWSGYTSQLTVTNTDPQHAAVKAVKCRTPGLKLQFGDVGHKRSGSAGIWFGGWCPDMQRRDMRHRDMQRQDIRRRDMRHRDTQRLDLDRLDLDHRDMQRQAMDRPDMDRLDMPRPNQ